MTSASVVSINSQLKHYTHTRQTFSTPGYCFNHKCLPSRSYNYLYEDMRLSAVYIAVPLAWSLVSVIQMQPVHVIRMRLAPQDAGPVDRMLAPACTTLDKYTEQSKAELFRYSLWRGHASEASVVPSTYENLSGLRNYVPKLAAECCHSKCSNSLARPQCCTLSVCALLVWHVPDASPLAV